jgi:transposase
VEKARQRVDLSSLRVVGVDECSKEKGHDYLTIFSDLDKSRVVFVAESRKEQVVKEFRKDLQERKVKPQQIEQFCSDMWEPYLRGFEKEFPEASVTFDRYHVISLMNRALDEVRREEQRNNSMLKHTRYIWLKNP